VTDHLDVDTRVTRFLQSDAPGDVPERLIYATRDQVANTRQRRWAGLFGRLPASALLTPVAAAGVLAIVAVAAALTLSNRFGSTGTQPGPSLLASPAMSASPSIAASASACAPAGESCLAAGTYTSSLFVPPVTYTVPAGWIRTLDVRGELDLKFGAGGQYTYPDGLTFHDAVSIFRRPVAESSTSLAPLSGVGTKANDLAQWLVGHPDLVASAPTHVVIGGVDAFRLVLSLPTGIRTAPDHCTSDHGEPRCESLFISSDPAATYGFGLVGPETAVVYLLDLPSGDTVMVVIDDVDGVDQPGLVAAATPVVESLAFSP
jgi:hypothetical protein